MPGKQSEEHIKKLDEYFKKWKLPLVLIFLWFTYAGIANMIMVTGIEQSESAWLVPYLLPGYLFLQVLGIADGMSSWVIIWVSTWACFTAATSSAKDEEECYYCVGFCTLIQSVIILIGAIVIIFFSGLNFLFYAPMLVFVVVSTVVVGNYICGVPGETTKAISTPGIGKANWVIFWFNVDSSDELPMPVDVTMKFVIEKFGLLEKISSNAKISTFYKHDPDFVSKMQSGDTEEIQYIAVALAKRVGMSDEDFEKFGHIKFFQIGGIHGFVAY